MIPWSLNNFVASMVKILAAMLSLVIINGCADKDQPSPQTANTAKLSDTSIVSLSLFDLTPYDIQLPRLIKKTLVVKAFNATQDSETDDYAERPLKDFYFIDIDKDGDTD